MYDHVLRDVLQERTTSLQKCQMGFKPAAIQVAEKHGENTFCPAPSETRYK